jgi:hypothetical protein
MMLQICLLIKQINGTTDQKTDRRIAQPENRVPVFFWSAAACRRFRLSSLREPLP